ncbi:ABC transporter permease, partial [Klebsiella aerogenes]
SGLVSFGQGLYYCIGGYAIGLGGQLLQITDIFVLLALAATAGLVTGGILGLVMSRYREIFFAMFSLALSMILYGVLSRTQSLGSTDGFNVA